MFDLLHETRGSSCSLLLSTEPRNIWAAAVIKPVTMTTRDPNRTSSQLINLQRLKTRKDEENWNSRVLNTSLFPSCEQT